MKLPSVDRLTSSALATARRFPDVIAAAIVAMVAGLVLVDDPSDGIWGPVMAAATLALPASFTITMAAERWNWSSRWRALAMAGLAVALAAFCVAWSGWSEGVRVRRYIQLSLSLHLAAAFVPYLGVDEQRGFWQYNRTLLLRFLTALLYVAVLQVGLSLALSALDHLFGVPVSHEAYLDLAVILGLVLQSWFFLAGVPEDLDRLEQTETYPRSLGLFTRYVLVPLVVVYLLILTAYGVKVLWTWDWPSGWIGWLVSGVAVVGILAYLLVHPVRGRSENQWVRIYGRWFWVGLLPSVALLGMAIWQRVAQYGMTEDRYFLVLGALWLGGIALYYVTTRSESIEHIPRTLCAVLLVSAFGPWSAYEMSERSQRTRLEGLLSRNGMLVDGRAHPASQPIDEEAPREISAVVRYLLERHGEEALTPLFGDPLPAASVAPDGGPVAEAQAPPRQPAGPTPESVVTSIGVEYVNRWEARRTHVNRQPPPFTLRAHGSAGTAGAIEHHAVRGYDYVVRGLRSHSRDTLTLHLTTQRGAVEPVRLVPDLESLDVLVPGHRPLTVNVAEVSRRLRGREDVTQGRVPTEAMWHEVEEDGLRAALWLQVVNGHFEREAREGVDSPATVGVWTATLFLDLPPKGISGPSPGHPRDR